jgi:hypothetical protein
MYMTAVEAVPGDAEISSALKELEFSPNTLQIALFATADRVLRSAPEEFAAYAVARELAEQDPDETRAARRCAGTSGHGLQGGEHPWRGHGRVL